MSLFKTTSLISVIHTSDYERALAWYQRWLGQPDEVPMEGMAEWQLMPSAWVQLDSSAPDKAGQSAVALGVDDVARCREAWLAAGVVAGEIADYGFVQVCDAHDPDGNRVSLVQVCA